MEYGSRFSGRGVWLALSTMFLAGSCYAGNEPDGSPGFFHVWLSALSHEIWLIFVWVLGSILAAKLTRFLWVRVFLRAARLAHTSMNGVVFEKTQNTIQVVVLVAILDLGLRKGAPYVPSFSGHPAWDLCDAAVYVVLVLSITLALYEALMALTDWYGRKLMGRASGSVDDEFLALFQKTAKVVCFFIAITIILEHFGVKITALLATAGVASLAVALAAQDTLSNMISGFVVMIDRPFKIGDKVELANGKGGDILEVGIRSTRIITPDNTVITLPNAEVAKGQIVNYNMPNSRFKIRASVSIVHDSDVRKAKKGVLAAIVDQSDVLKDPAPVVLFTEIGESGLKLYYEYWISSYLDQGRVTDLVNMAIKDFLDAQGIRIAIPQRVVHVQKGL